MKISICAPARRTTLDLVALALTALFCAACGSVSPTVTGSGRKWVGPTIPLGLGGEWRTVIWYGPWQCSRTLWRYCEETCAGEGYSLRGCVWLADVKMDFDGRFVDAGSRAGITHCCCNYDELSTTETKARRERWEALRDSFREEWAKKFGAWPQQPNGAKWPGHHIRDLKHGGNPTDWDNIIPMDPAVHALLNGVYNQCYAGNHPWTGIGVDHPYGE